MTTTISMSVDPPLISGEYCSVISRELPTMTPLASSNFSFESRIAKFTSVLPLVIPKLEDIFEKSAILIQNNNNRKITNSKNRGPDNTNRTQLRSCCSQGLCKSSVLSVLFIVLFVKDRETSLRSIPVLFNIPSNVLIVNLFFADKLLDLKGTIRPVV